MGNFLKQICGMNGLLGLIVIQHAEMDLLQEEENANKLIFYALVMTLMLHLVTHCAMVRL